MDLSETHDFYLRLIRGVPFVEDNKASFYVCEADRSKRSEQESALESLMAENLIDNYDYIGDAEIPVIVIEIRSRHAASSSTGSVNEAKTFAPSSTNTGTSLYLQRGQVLIR